MIAGVQSIMCKCRYRSMEKSGFFYDLHVIIFK